MIWNDCLNSFCISHAYVYIYAHWNDEGISFMTFIWKSLYPKGDNASKDEGL
jgi:hypothetical protein